MAGRSAIQRQQRAFARMLELIPSGVRRLTDPTDRLATRLQLKRTTCEDYIAILKWSFECLDRNEMPVTRHDGSAFAYSDSWRKGRAGKVIGVRGRLVELRGDWSMFKHVLGLPGWQETGPCCWKCGTTRTALQEVGLHAAWRRERLSHADFLRHPSCDRGHHQNRLASRS